MDLTTFLLDRIAEDEAAAREASPGPWHPDEDHYQVLAVDDITVADGFALSNPQWQATVNHIALHDPPRVLAECAAKQRIVVLHEDPHTCESSDEEGINFWSAESGSEEHHVDGVGGPLEGCQTLRLLALPYADHPQYQEEWRP